MNLLLVIVAVIAALFFGFMVWAAGIVSGRQDGGRNADFNTHDAHAWAFIALAILFAMLAGWGLR